MANVDAAKQKNVRKTKSHRRFCTKLQPDVHPHEDAIIFRNDGMKTIDSFPNA